MDDIHLAVQLFTRYFERLERTELRKRFVGKGELDGEPSEDEVDAYLLTLRLFIQGNDPVPFSIRALSSIYKDNCTPEHQAEYEEIRKFYNDEMDKPTPFAYNGQYYSYKEVFDGFIYGVHAHANWKKQADFLEKISSPLGRFLNQGRFFAALEFTHGRLIEINELNSRAFPS